MRQIFHGTGVISSNGVRWNHNRRFALRQLRDLGMGKSRLVGAVHTQANMLVKELKKQAGRPAPLPHAMNIAIINIIWQMIAGESLFTRDVLSFASCYYILRGKLFWMIRSLTDSPQMMPLLVAFSLFVSWHSMEELLSFQITHNICVPLTSLICQVFVWKTINSQVCLLSFVHLHVYLIPGSHIIQELYSTIYSNTGIQFEKDDPKMKEFQELLDELVVTINRVAILDFFPWMNKILPASLVSWICRVDALDNFKERMCIYIKVSKCSNGLMHSKWF